MIRSALDDLSDDLDHVDVGGHRLWFDPRMPSRTSRAHPAYLLSTFDEVCLTYRETGFPRRDPTAPRARLLSEGGGGIVVVGDEDVGVWKRVVTPKAVRVTVWGDTPLDRADQAVISTAATAFAAFLERPARPDLRLDLVGDDDEVGDPVPVAAQAVGVVAGDDRQPRA